VKRRPQDPGKQAITLSQPLGNHRGDIGVVLSGGGSRAAYQVGVLKALEPFFTEPTNPISVVVGSSIGAINGLLMAACLKSGFHSAMDELESLWVEREYKNTFSGSASRAFFRSIKIALIQYLSPGPNPSNTSIFDPTPLMNRVDATIVEHGGLHPEKRAASLRSVGVMTTMEGKERKPLLFLSTHKKVEPEMLLGASFQVCYVETLHAKHGFASAALPSVLPPVELDTDMGRVRLVDGGISQNVPVDPAARLGAQRIVLIDVSGRDWWLNRYGEAHDTRPTWEVAAEEKTFCFRPPETFIVRCQKPLGPILKEVVGKSTRRFVAAVGACWPLFSLLKNKLGEEVAYETMAYVALDPEYSTALIERGFNEAMSMMRNKNEIEFKTQPYSDPTQVSA